MEIAFSFVYKQYPNWLLSAFKELKTLSTEARRAIVIQTIGSSIVAHHNHINVRKVVTPTSRTHHFNRPKLPITIKPQWMPWCIALHRLLAIPKLQNQDG